MAEACSARCAGFAEWLGARPGVARVQRWFMGTVFGGLALRLALDTDR